MATSTAPMRRLPGAIILGNDSVVAFGTPERGLRWRLVERFPGSGEGVSFSGFHL